LDGNYDARIFQITDDSLNVIIKNLVFVNGETSENGGAISGKCAVINCTFIYNTAFYVKRSMRLHIPSSPEITPIWDLPYIQMISAMLLITLSF